MRNLFNPILHCDANVILTSSAVVVTGLPTNEGQLFAQILTTDSPGTFLKNGADAGTVCPVQNGDSLQISGRSSTANATPVFVSYQVGDDIGVFTLVTKETTTPTAIVGFDGLIPLDVTASQNSTSEDYGTSVSCVVSQYDAQDGSFVNTTPILGDFSATGAAGLPFVDYYSGVVSQIDPTSYAVVGQTEVGMQPYESCTANGWTWVSISTQNRVVALDQNNAVVMQVQTGQRPLGLASWKDASGNWHILVANNNGGTATHITQNGSQWTPVTVTLGPKPFEVAVDGQGNAWVTNTGSLNSLWKINLTTNAVTVVATTGGVAPRCVVYNPVLDRLHVTCTTNNKLLTIVPQTNAITVLAMPPAPYAMSVSPTGTVYVACFTSSQIVPVASGAVQSMLIISVDPYPYKVQYVNGSILVTNYYGLPSHIADQVSLGFGIIDPVSIPQETLIGSSTVAINGVDTPTVCAVPNVYGAQLVKNGVGAGTSTTVVSGDQVNFTFTSPHTQSTKIDIPFYVGNTHDSFQSVTSFEDATPDVGLFAFSDSTGLPVSTAVVSNTFTITGIDPAVKLPFTVTAGSIQLNGVDQHNTVVQVGLNDVVAIIITTPPKKNMVLQITATLAQFQAAWKVATLVSQIYWIRPEFKGTGIFDQSFAANTIAKAVRATQAGGYEGDIDLHATPSGEQLRNKKYLYIPSFYEDCVYRVTDQGQVAEVISLPSGSHPLAIATAPRVSKTPAFLAAQLVTLVGAHAVMNIATGVSIPMPSAPAAIVAVDDGSFVYVSLPDSSEIAILTPSGSSYAMTGTIATGGKPYDMVLDGTTLYFSDKLTNLVRQVVNKAVTTKVWTMGYGIWDMDVTNGVLTTVNSYDNTISRASLLTPGPGSVFPVGSVPCSVAVNGNVATVSHLGTTDLYTLDLSQTSNVPVVSASTHNATGLADTTTEIFGPAPFDNALSLPYIELEGAMDPLVWPDLLDQPLGTTVQSAEAVVSGVVRTAVLTAAPSKNYRFYLNDVLTGYSFTVQNGDRVKVEVDIGNDYNVDFYINLASYSTTSTFHAQSQQILTMNDVVFFPQSGILIREICTSNTVVVSGLSPGAYSPLVVYNSQWVEWTIILNGVLQSNTPVKDKFGLLTGHVTMAKNGDTIALHGICRGQYNSVTDYVLLSDGSPVGTLTLSNILLDGVEDERVVHREEHWGTMIGDPQAQFIEAPKYDLVTVDQPVPTPMPLYALNVVDVERTAVMVNKTLVKADNAVTFERGVVSATATVALPLGRATPYNTSILKTVDKSNFTSSPQTIGALAPLPKVVMFDRIEVIKGPVKVYQGVPAGIGHLVDKSKWVQVESVLGHEVDAVKWEQTPLHGDQEIRFHYLKNKTTTPKEYAVQYVRAALHTPIKPNDVFVRNAIHARVVEVPQVERNALHNEPVVKAQYRRNQLHYEPVVNALYGRNLYHVAPTPTALYTRNSMVPPKFADTDWTRNFVQESPQADTMWATHVGLSAQPVNQFEAVKQTNAIPVPVDLPMAFVTQQGTYVLVDLPLVLDHVGRSATFDEDTDAPTQGLFATPEEAVAYATTLGFIGTAVQIGNFWTWITPPRRQNANCLLTQPVIPAKWYVHGG